MIHQPKPSKHSKRSLYLWRWHWTCCGLLPRRGCHAISGVSPIGSGPRWPHTSSWGRSTTVRTTRGKASAHVGELGWVLGVLLLCVLRFGRLTAVGSIRWLRECWLLGWFVKSVRTWSRWGCRARTWRRGRRCGWGRILCRHRWHWVRCWACKREKTF